MTAVSKPRRTKALLFASYLLLLAPAGLTLGLMWLTGPTSTASLVALTISAFMLTPLFVAIGKRPGTIRSYLPPVAEPAKTVQLRLKDEAHRFGSNGVQVANFLARLPGLTSAHWEVIRHGENMDGVPGLRVLVREERRRAALKRIASSVGEARSDAEAAAHAAMAEGPLGIHLPDLAAERETIARIQRGEFVDPSKVPLGLVAAENALSALVYRDLLRPKHFAALYGAFELIVPSASLG
jgi:hypothetical protein